MDIGKYSFVNRTIEDWNQLPAEVLGSLPCKQNTLKKEGKESDYWGVLKKNKVCGKSFKSVMKGSEVKWKSSKSVKKCSEVKWWEV